MRSRETRLVRLEAHQAHTDEAAQRHRKHLRALVALGEAIRYSLKRAGVDPAKVKALLVCDEAATELAGLGAATVLGARAPTAARLSPFDLVQWGPNETPANGFWKRIDRMAEGYLDDPNIDFADAALMQVLAWCVAQTANASPPPEREEADTGKFCC
jgi:hypothetical protein